ncbi:Dual-specificity RNA methyltransferase RlmN [Buchnera aphidicola (Pterocallis alni)]|uniref:23S rRNA (adenine(2503)-C(2))-methyltransferase RlmN n=1 Tax=Buchnera aphidicola TaxID=9 RepID=UPI003464451B
MQNTQNKNINLTKINLLNLNRKKMYNFLQNISEPKFRAHQIMIWIYHHFCNSFDNMTNINNDLKKKLNNISTITPPKFIKEIISSDNTIKWLVSVKGGLIETIYIPEKKRGTLCISSQVGCILNCHFCATGLQKFKRNLLVSEIIGQIWIAIKKINKMDDPKYPKITNIVMMGMGEPLFNFNNVLTAINIISDTFGFNFTKKKIIISTSGIVPAIYKLSSLLDVKLAISLHASNDTLRNKLMPINKKYNISSLLNAIKQFIKTSKLNKKGITIEYVMLHNINDSLLHAKELIQILKNIPIKINLIPWNKIPNSIFKSSTKEQINKFLNFLNQHNIMTTIRKPRGEDIQAACGQLTGNLPILKTKT